MIPTMAIQNQRADNNRNPLKEHLLKKFPYSFKQSGHPTPMQEVRIQTGLREVGFALETPNLMDSSFKTRQQRRFKTALKSNKLQHPTLAKHRTEELQVVTDRGSNVGDDAEYDRKVKESVVFDFGNDYGNWADSDLVSDCFYLINNDKVILDNFSIKETGDRKYFRDDIFRLSSSKEVYLEFS